MGERLVNALNVELDLIEDDDLANFAEQALMMVDDSYCDMPSSPSGMYHQPGESQVLHIRRVVYLLTIFCNMLKIEEKARDIFLVAGILHDMCKFKKEEDGSYHTDIMHPLLPRLKLKGLNVLLDSEGEQFETIMDLIEGHMGIWGVNPKFIPRFNEQENMFGVEWILHMADNIATKYWGEV